MLKFRLFIPFISFSFLFFFKHSAPVGKPITTVGKLFHQIALNWRLLMKTFILFLFSQSLFNATSPSPPNITSTLLCLAHNTSSTSVRISWKAPPTDTIHGEFLGYRITYRARDKQPEDIKEIYIRDSNVEVCSVINLSYDFVCRAFFGESKRGGRKWKCDTEENLHFFHSFLLFLFIYLESRNNKSWDIHAVFGFTSSLQSWRAWSQFDCFDYDWWRQ